jgi:hypothetical protein
MRVINTESYVFILHPSLLPNAYHHSRRAVPCSVTTYNELLALDEAYEAFSMRKVAAIERAKALADESLYQVNNIVRQHDRRANTIGKHPFLMPALPEGVAKWLS